jgi:GNAT superfamily N-acetyltransferase
MDELGLPHNKRRMLQRMENINSNPMHCTFDAEVEGNVIGMVGELYSYEGDNVAVQISALVTKIEYRGLGIGKQLVTTAEKCAKENGANVIVLTSGNRQEREEAHQFYKHLGFNITGFRFSKRL